MSLVLTARGEAVLSAAWSGTQAVLAGRLADCTAADLAALGQAFRVLGELFACDGAMGQCLTAGPRRSKRRESAKSGKAQSKAR